MLHQPTHAFGPSSLPAADPTARFVAKPGDEDAALIALCRVALRALEEDEALTCASEDLGEKYEAMKPAYPRLPWMYGLSVELAPTLPSSRLRELAAGPGHDAKWRTNMRKQIVAVVRWEKECAAIMKSIGLTALHRRLDRALAKVQEHVGAVALMEATTLQGATYKALTVTAWIRTGYSFADIGEKLALSIVDDVRRLGADECRRRRPARGGAAAELH